MCRPGSRPSRLPAGGNGKWAGACHDEGHRSLIEGLCSSWWPDAVPAEAEQAGGAIAKPAQEARWGGYFGYFADPDGNLWKVVPGDGDRPSPSGQPPRPV
jgi:hypothetical protein